MVRQPAVFLMDEPLSNRDVALRISMRAEIKHLHQEMRTTFVYVTHDQAEALTLADRIVVMKEGQIQQIGTPNEVYDRPSNMFVASFLGNPPINYLEGAIEDEAGTPVFRYGSLRISLPAGKLRGVTAAPVLLGIRPEDVLRDSASGWPVLTGVVDSVLPVGSDRFLGLKVEGCDVFVRVDKGTHHVLGQRVSFGLRPERLHLFDKASGASLIGGAA
jgi:multiple sugar transport system ATP-binding protein